jgi:hypothetical protein
MRKGILMGAAVAAMLMASTVRAQGSLSLQGFGYPPGELSTRALGTAGAIGGIDPRSPINPAAIAVSAIPQIYAQYDPEFRKVTAAGKVSTTTTTRMPNIGGVLPLNGNFVLGVSASTLLDRSWETNLDRTQQFGVDTVNFNERINSDGSITDVRFALAYSPSRRIHFGVAYHTFPGSVQLTSNELFPDTTIYQNITQISEVSYSGSAFSAGFVAEVLPGFNVSLSGRKGGTAKMFVNDSMLTTGDIPDSYSGSLSYSGIPGTTIAIRQSHTSWSSMDGLSYAGTKAVDANDFSAGVESNGPRIGGFPMSLRAGFRQRTLPFQVGSASIKETSFGGGLGIPIAYDRVVLDIAALRTSRTGVAGVNERAYNLSFGLRVRP